MSRHEGYLLQHEKLIGVTTLKKVTLILQHPLAVNNAQLEVEPHGLIFHP